MSPSTSVSPGATRFDGEISPPRPSPRAWIAPVPSSAMPPLPFSPVGFSGLIERDFAEDSRDRLPRCNPRPEKPSVMPIPSSASARLLDARRLNRLDDALLEDHEHDDRRKRHDGRSGHHVVPRPVVLLT